MKKSLLLTMLVMLGTLLSSATTVYFERPAGVTMSTTIKVYTWAGAEKFNGDWPGSEIAGTTETIDGKTYIKEEIDNRAEKFIFNWDGGQTSNLTPVENGVYSSSDQIGTIVNGHFVAAEEKPMVRYYVRIPGWSNIYVYSWEGDVNFGNWPGTDITGNTEVLKDGITYNYFEAPEDKSIGNFKFNAGENKAETSNFSNAVVNGIYGLTGYTGKTKDQLIAPVGSEVYFFNDLDWRTVYAYVWKGPDDNVTELNGAYPGAALTTTKTVDGKEVFVADFEGAEQIIFSCFDNTHESHLDYGAYDWEKTSDLDYVPGTIYTASASVIENKPEAIYIVGGGIVNDKGEMVSHWVMEDDGKHITLTTDSDDSNIYTGDVKISGNEFRLYSKLDGNWDTGSYGAKWNNGEIENITFNKGNYSCTAVKNGKGNWKLPTSYKGQTMKFTFNYLTKEFNIYDPSVITVKELLVDADDAVVPAEGTYADKDAIVASGDDDGLATITITLQPGVHVNRDCTAPAIFYNNGRKLFELHANVDPKEINDLNHIGIHAISGNSFDYGTDQPTKFQIVISNSDGSVVAYKGENELKFPDGFFMLGGEVEIKSDVITNAEGDEETIEWEHWTGGTDVKGGLSFVWNVTEADRAAVDPVAHIEGAEDEITHGTSDIMINVNKYDKHDYYAHITVKEVNDPTAAERNINTGKGVSNLIVDDLKPGTLHEISYHFHATQGDHSVDPAYWVRDDHGEVCQHTHYVLTQPTAVYNAAAKTLKFNAGIGTIILYTTDGSEPDPDGSMLEGMKEMMGGASPASIAYAAADDEDEPATKYLMINDPEDAEVDNVEIPVGGALKMKSAAVNMNDGTFVDAPMVTDTVTGVAAIEAAEGEVEFFNLQGVRVDNPEKGIYIMVKNGKANK
ncbi:MAG: starch-binding protein, partial [Muribaculaceae bacterium]|nr:starch-binding protein [Muribaculaceae bacterium]